MEGGAKVRNLIVVVGLVALVCGGIYFAVPYLKPTNDAFAPTKPSSHVSKRLKGVFSGMKVGFGN